MRPSVLVTGGAGYIGSHACKALARAGYLPVAYDNLVSGHHWAVKWGPLEVGDVCDPVRLIQVIRKHQPVAVMHFAAFICVGESVVDPAKYYRNNFTGAMTVLEALRATNLIPFLFSSTCATYGVPERVPIDESHPKVPVNPYGHSKFMVECLLQDYAHAYGLSFAMLRYFNAAGADLDGEIGECHDPETHLIPLLLQTAAGARPALEIYGHDYPTADGTAVRDYVHVSDLADAHVRALVYLLDGGQPIALNLGTGRGYSVREVVAEAEMVTGRSIKTVLAPRRPGDTPALVADGRLAREVLEATFPLSQNLTTILETAWRWQLRGLSTGAAE
ncbi:MAG: UDP-glucose 4-epimerase GalE [Alphaproteobacteria bacterium]|nr:UDP-glucose 4-epimerase GalE [Alphaproteobacteria bacterium]